MPRDVLGTNEGGKLFEVAAVNAPTRYKALADVVCDGVNDQVEINAALAAGKRVVLSEGTFTLGDSVTMTQSGASLRGLGPGTALQITGAISGDHIIKALGAGEGSELEGLQIADLKLIGYGDDSGVSLDHGIYFNWVKDSAVERILGRDVTFCVVAVNNAQGCTIDRITGKAGALGAHGGWYLVACSNLTPTDKYAGHSISNLVSFLPEHALSLTHTDYCTVTNITSRNNNTDYVVNLQGSQHVTVMNVEARDAAGLFFTEAWNTRFCDYTRLIGGSMTKASAGGATSAYGANITDAPNTLIEGVSFYMTNQTAGHGIKLDADCDYSQVRGCKVYDPFDKGIYVENATDYVEISGCGVRSAGGRGIEAGTGPGARVFGNHSEANTGPGFYIASIDYQCFGNTAIGNTGDGITLAFADDGMVTNNRCKGNGGYGINVSNANCDRNVVAYNNVRGNTTGALQDLGTATTSTGNITV